MPHANPSDAETAIRPVSAGMTRDTLHAFLTRHFDLHRIVADEIARYGRRGKHETTVTAIEG
ncbi:hypothetical protein [Ralstonia solanacearum]|uniref:hypothetical protein n=1 Tax=Ralstonia solanacearum TaxID=305 RepID=UPI0006DBFAF6|nr:hypothetical protein [Ralstonia solanacearum]